MNDIDLDLEEIESRLYSQVFHGLDDETTENNSETYSGVNILPELTNNMRKSGRYFGPWTPGSKFQSRPPSKQSTKANSKSSCKSDTHYFKNYGKQSQHDISIDQVVVVSPNRPIVFMNSRERGRAKRRAKLKEKIRQRRALKAQKDKEIHEKPPEVVITLSDTDDNDDSCVVVEKKWPTLSVDSDDENKSKDKERLIENKETSDALNETLSDDVIFVEPVVVPPEIINIDEELETLEKTSSTSSENISILNNSKKEKLAKKQQKERRELLSTPDSASNDFISNSGVELNQENFNFSLHGADFRSGDFLKPAPKHNETCETESSSSTIDINSVNLMKTAVFNEVDFPKDDIFSESNLESFGNFITPLRRNATVKSVHSSPLKQAENHVKNVYTSNSSSESDLEESQIDTSQMKGLPDLSPMISRHDVPSVPIKIKNLSNLCSKYDLLSTSLNKAVKKIRKKKKNKKKKQSETEEEQTDNSNKSNNEDNVQEEEPKRKKKRSSQMEGDLEKQQKKKSSSSLSEVIGEQNTEIVSDEIVIKSEEGLTETDSTQKDERAAQDSQPTLIDLGKVIIKYDSDESETTKNKNDETERNLSISQFEDFVVVDETISDSNIVISDSESVLSALNENSDIQFNVTESDSKNDAETFSVRKLQEKMSSDPNLWKILDCDLTPTVRIRGRRCNKCRQWGHMAIRCTNKMEIKCSLCGAKGHFEPRCPNKLCTQCGKSSPFSTTYCSACFKLRNSICSICSLRGHLSESCPDLWRRYHLTTEEGPLKTYTGPSLKERNELWCSGCAQSGHLEHACNFHKSVYPPSDPFIKSYEDVYVQRDFRPHSNQHSPSKRSQQEVPIQPQYLRPNYSDFNNYYYPETQYGGQSQPNYYYPPIAQNMQYQPNFPFQQYNYENAMADYISFETTPQQNESNFMQLPASSNDGLIEAIKSSYTLANRNSIFFSSTAIQLQHFINDELHRLGKLSYLSNKIIKELKRRQVPSKRNVVARKDYYETLNMLLFGVMNMYEGKMHLERLRKFKRDKLKHKLSASVRKFLYKSYCYIFGRDKHSGVHYDELLRQI